MRQRNYPLEVMHGYVIPARDAAEFASLVERVDTESLVAVGAISQRSAGPRWPMARSCWRKSSGAASPSKVVISIGGLREGLLYEQLSPELRARDPLHGIGARI